MKLLTNGKGSDVNKCPSKKKMFDVSVNCSRRFEHILNEVYACVRLYFQIFSHFTVTFGILKSIVFVGGRPAFITVKCLVGTRRRVLSVDSAATLIFI